YLELSRQKVQEIEENEPSRADAPGNSLLQETSRKESVHTSESPASATAPAVEIVQANFAQPTLIPELEVSQPIAHPNLEVLPPSTAADALPRGVTNTESEAGPNQPQIQAEVTEEAAWVGKTKKFALATLAVIVLMF